MMRRRLLAPGALWLRRALLLAGAALGFGGCDVGVAPPGTYRAVLTIDAGPLLSSGQNHFASVIEFAEVAVLHEDGSTSSVRAPLGVQQPTAAIEIRVPPGTHRFEGRVVSNNGTVLVEGTRVADVQADGFTVDIDLRPVAPLLVVFPDSVRTTAFDQGDAVFTIANLGVGTLAWQIINLDPPQTSCEQGCFRFVPEGGQIAPGGAVPLRVFGPIQARYRGLYRLRLGSPVGTVELEIFAETG